MHQNALHHFEQESMLSVAAPASMYALQMNQLQLCIPSSDEKSPYRERQSNALPRQNWTLTPA